MALREEQETLCSPQFSVHKSPSRRACWACSNVPFPAHPDDIHVVMLCRDESPAQVEAEVILQSKRIGRANQIELRQTRSSFNLDLDDLRDVGKNSIVSYNEKEPRQMTKCRSSFAIKTTHTARNRFGLLPPAGFTSKRPSWPVSGGRGTYPDLGSRGCHEEVSASAGFA
jgi:hypothetical protein